MNGGDRAGTVCTGNSNREESSDGVIGGDVREGVRGHGTDRNAINRHADDAITRRWCDGEGLVGATSDVGLRTWDNRTVCALCHGNGIRGVGCEGRCHRDVPFDIGVGARVCG